MILSGKKKPTKTSRTLYAVPDFVSGSQFGQQLIPEVPGTNSFQPTNGGNMAVTPYSHVKMIMPAIFLVGTLRGLPTLLKLCNIAKLIIVRQAIVAIPTEPFMNPDHIHRDWFSRTL